jgi:two-component system LytT family response regulator
LSVVLVDDEAPAREKLRHLLRDDSRLTIVGEAGDGLEAVGTIEATRPDVAFLDIQMPEMGGFAVLEALDPEATPAVIFVTAHDEHALRAFEVRALDYLLKPVHPERLREAVERVVESRALRGNTQAPATGAGSDPRAVLRELPASRRRLDRFLVRLRGSMTLIAASEVDWIGAADNYVELHVGAQLHLVRGTLQELEERLPDCFARIHRSAIVNLDRVSKLQPWSHGDWLLQLKDGTELRLSRRYRDRLTGVFGG